MLLNFVEAVLMNIGITHFNCWFFNAAESLACTHCCWRDFVEKEKLFRILKPWVKKE